MPQGDKKIQVNVRLAPWAVQRLRRLREWVRENMSPASQKKLIFKREKYVEAFFSADASFAGILLQNAIAEKYDEERRWREIEAIVFDIEAGHDRDSCLERSKKRGLVKFGSGRLSDDENNGDENVEIDEELEWWLERAWTKALLEVRERNAAAGTEPPLVVKVQELNAEIERLRTENYEMKKMWTAISDLAEEHQVLSEWTESELKRLESSKQDAPWDDSRD